MKIFLGRLVWLPSRQSNKAFVRWNIFIGRLLRELDTTSHHPPFLAPANVDISHCTRPDMDDCLITNNFRQLGAGRGGELVSININKSVIIIILLSYWHG